MYYGFQISKDGWTKAILIITLLYIKGISNKACDIWSAAEGREKEKERGRASDPGTRSSVKSV